MAKLQTISINEQTTLKDLEKTYIDLDTQITLLEGQKSYLKDQIVCRMEKKEITKDELVQLVYQERTNIDESILKAALSQKTWSRIVKEVVDKKLLEASIEIGDIKPEIVEAAVTKKEIKVLRIN